MIKFETQAILDWSERVHSAAQVTWAQPQFPANNRNSGIMNNRFMFRNSCIVVNPLHLILLRQFTLTQKFIIHFTGFHEHHIVTFTELGYSTLSPFCLLCLPGRSSLGWMRDSFPPPLCHFWSCSLIWNQRWLGIFGIQRWSLGRSSSTPHLTCLFWRFNSFNFPPWHVKLISVTSQSYWST